MHTNVLIGFQLALLPPTRQQNHCFTCAWKQEIATTQPKRPNSPQEHKHSPWQISTVLTLQLPSKNVCLIFHVLSFIKAVPLETILHYCHECLCFCFYTMRVGSWRDQVGIALKLGGNTGICQAVGCSRCSCDRCRCSEFHPGS